MKALILIFAIILSLNTYAWGALRVTVTPPTIEVKGGGAKAITILNHGDTRIYFRVNVVEWVRSPSGGSIYTKVKPGRPKHPRSSAGWIEVYPETMILDPGEAGKIILTASPPKGLDLTGSFWAGITFEFYRLPEQGEVKLTGRLISGVYVVIEPGVKKAEITGIELVKRDENLTFKSNIENTGDMHLRLSGYVEIWNVTGDKLGKYDIEKGVLFPNDIGVFGTKVSDIIPYGRYKFLTIIDYGGDVYIGAEKWFDIEDV